MLVILCLVLCYASFSNCANILAIVPIPSYSHQIAYMHLWKELSLRGHKMTLVTTDPLHDPKLVNLTEIDMKWAYKFIPNVGKAVQNNEMSMWQVHQNVFTMIKAISEAQLSSPPIHDLIHNNNKSYDLLFVHFMFTEWLAFAEIYKCPTILFANMEMSASFYHITGNPSHPVLHPEFVSPFHGQLTFKERVVSTLLSWYYLYFFAYTVKNEKQKILNKYYDTNSSITDLLNNVDMMFLSTSLLIHGPRALGPNTISIGGYREDILPEPLPSELKTFLDEAKEGCIYVSFGSNVKSSQLSHQFLKPIIEALADVPYKVLWKFEAEAENLPKNIKTAKWLPQQKVLNHPNVKLFLYHGGLQSMEEAIYGEVPFVVIPFVSDQYQHAKILKDKGVAIVLNRLALEKIELKNAILEVMNEPKYREGVKRLKQLILDQPMTGLEKSVWWTEYVIRNKGAKHLRNPAVDIPLYQYFLLDVVGFLLLTIILIVTALVITLKKVSSLIQKLYRDKKKMQ